MDGYFITKEIKVPKRRKSIEFYRDNIARIDRKLMALLNNAYMTLHLDGYYDGNVSVDTINSGFKSAYLIIDKIKPEA